MLREYARLAAAGGRRTISLDCRIVDPTPFGFELALRESLGLSESESPLDHLGTGPGVVLLLDTYELLAPVDDWLRSTFLPQLPADALVVVAGRSPPDAAWTTDAGWNEMARVISLRNLRPEESRAFLTERRVPEEQHAPVLAFSHGHPLALSLVADSILRRDPMAPFRPGDAPDIVRVLLERFLVNVPDPRHRYAVEICAHARFTTEALLAEMAAPDEAHELFEWLRGLPFIEQGSDGLFPHDLAREVLEADLRWRDPTGYSEMHRRIWTYLRRRIRETTGRAQQRVFFDKLYLHRGNSVGGRFHDLMSLGNWYAEPLRTMDRRDILDTVERHEGEESSRIVAQWLDLQPEAFLVLHGKAGELLGFVVTLVLQDAGSNEFEFDPAIRAAWTFTRQHAPVRAGEIIVHHRFHMMYDGYQDVSPVINLLALSTTLAPIRHPRLTWSFVTFAPAESWLPIMCYINFERALEAEFTVDQRRFAVFGHDWRVESFDAWWEIQGERAIATDFEPASLEVIRPAPLVVLSEPDFRASVRQALRDFARPSALATNPLLRSRLVVEAAGNAPTGSDLQTIVREAVERLRGAPRTEKFYRALLYTYIQPARSQENAAERLGLPFTTYRYHLARGTDCVSDSLWQRELYGARGATTPIEEQLLSS